MTRVQITIREDSPRLDLLLLEKLAETFPGLSRAKLKTWFSEGRILLRGRPLKASTLLAPGVYEIDVDGSAVSSIAIASSRGSFIPVVYEDSELLVLNKPSGIPSLPHSPDETETAVGSALAHFPSLSGVGRGGLEPGLLHRLDTGTSGVLAFAKTNDAFTRLREAWRSGGVRKIYRAIVSSEENSPQSVLRAGNILRLELGHDAKSARRMIVVRDGVALRGNPLPTETLIRAARETSRMGCFDVEIEIKTGVMHQIRCTLAHLGWPVMGDPIYRGKLAERLWLHAWRLEIPRASGASSVSGELLKLEAPVPEDWPS